MAYGTSTKSIKICSGGYLQNFREETFFKEHSVFSFTPVEGKKQDYHIVSVLETDKYA